MELGVWHLEGAPGAACLVSFALEDGRENRYNEPVRSAPERPAAAARTHGMKTQNGVHFHFISLVFFFSPSPNASCRKAMVSDTGSSGNIYSHHAGRIRLSPERRQNRYTGASLMLPQNNRLNFLRAFHSGIVLKASSKLHATAEPHKRQRLQMLRLVLEMEFQQGITGDHLMERPCQYFFFFFLLH